MNNLPHQIRIERTTTKSLMNPSLMNPSLMNPRFRISQIPSRNPSQRRLNNQANHSPRNQNQNPNPTNSTRRRMMSKSERMGL